MRSAGPEYGRPITIGDHVWLGGGVIVCPGVTIGDGAVAAAGAVITRDVPPYTLVGGNPARVIRELKARGIRLGIVSTKRSDTLEAILENRGVLGELDLIIGSDRVKRHKPDPEGLLAAMSRLGAGPEETLFCGDTVLDAGAAQNAGTEFAAVLNGTTSASAFREWPHVHIAPDLWDLKRWLEEQ